MAGTLLIIGITFIIVGTLVLAHDVTGRGRSWITVILPFTSMTHVREHWSAVWPAVMLRVMGTFAVCAGIGVFVAQNPETLEGRGPVVMKSQILSGSKVAGAADGVAANAALLINVNDGGDSRLSGVIYGRPFKTTRAELIDGVLSIQHGSGFIPSVEVRILTGAAEKEMTEREDLYVQVTDSSAPEVQISIVPTGGGLPETTIFKSGYSMELQLAPLSDNQLKGYLQLVLPGAKGSYLVGEFVANTNHLRYRRGGVDLTYDHIDTLRYLAKQYVKNQYPEAAVEKVQLLNTTMQLGRQSGTSIARVYLFGGRTIEKRLQFERGELGWSLLPGGVETTVLSEGGNGLGIKKPNALDDAEKKVEPPLEMAFADLESMTDQRVLITDKKGEKRVSKIIGMRRGLLQLESNVGSGVVQYTAARQDIVKLQLESGREITLEPITSETTAAASSAIDGSAVPTAPTSTVSEPVVQQDEKSSVAPPPTETPISSPAAQEGDAALARLVSLVGKTVEISSVDGKSRTGVLLSVNKKEVKLAVRLGSGTLEYFYMPADIKSVKEMAR
ncbi:MAG: hypothetical protein KBT87_04155 [Gammaproteobacteria bacterium]|nr:hypothetical protein [Gammaproteobacteria bacterium]MBQ0773846.1 hypothetical protein [Gammaproteobacteria bacterium]